MSFKKFSTDENARKETKAGEKPAAEAAKDATPAKPAAESAPANKS